jgi:hypothetical protein
MAENTNVVFLNLPDHPNIQEEFGRRRMGRGKKKDLPKSMCLQSALYDPVNYLTLDVQTGPTDGSEQELLLQHLSKVEMGLGDYADLVSVDDSFYGIYSATNIPNLNYFPNGVEFSTVFYRSFFL